MILTWEILTNKRVKNDGIRQWFPTQWLNFKRLTWAKCWQGCGANRTLKHCCESLKWFFKNHFEIACQFLTKLSITIHPSHTPEIPHTFKRFLCICFIHNSQRLKAACVHHQHNKQNKPWGTNRIEHCRVTKWDKLQLKANNIDEPNTLHRVKALD